MPEATRPPEIVQLWMLRLLTKGSDHRREVLERSRLDDELALALGLDTGDFTEPDSGAQRLSRLNHQRHELEARQPESPECLSQNLEALADMLALNPVEQQVLHLIVLYQLFPVFDDCYELARRKDTFDTTTRNMALMLQLPRGAIIDALAESGRLISSGLLSATILANNMLALGDFELPSVHLPRQLVYESVPPLVLLRSLVRAAPAGTLGLSDFDHIRTDLDILVPYLRQALRRDQTGVNVLLHGAPGTGKTELARCLSDRLGTELFELDYDPTQPDARSGRHRLQYYRAAQTLLPTRQSLLLFDEADDVLGGGDLISLVSRQRHATTEKSVVNRLLENNRIPTFWITNEIKHLDPAYARRFDVIVSLETLPRSKRRQIVEHCCGGAITTEQQHRLADLDAATPAILNRAMQVVRAGTRSQNAERLGNRVEHLVHRTLAAQGHSIRRPAQNHTGINFDPGYLNLDTHIKRLVQGLSRHPDARLCLHGAPGTGKTAFAAWLADRLDRPLQVQRASDLLSPWVGENEKNLAQAFTSAQRAGAVLLVDEVDSFLQARSGAAQHWEVSGVNELLTQMEQFDGLFIAATNRLQSLDTAALRRFDLKLEFHPLTRQQAVKLLSHSCKTLNLPTPDTATQEQVAALTGLTPGDFAATLRRARFDPLASPAHLADNLAAECALKAPPRPIGF